MDINLKTQVFENIMDNNYVDKDIIETYLSVF
jgi:hypothetical protein